MNQVQPDTTANSSNQFMTCVRLTKEEYERLAESKTITGKSIPSLLKLAFFSKGIPNPLLDLATRKLLRRELAYVGNNLNQLTKRVNSGLISDLKDEVATLVNQVTKLNQLLELESGNRKNPV